MRNRAGHSHGALPFLSPFWGGALEVFCALCAGRGLARRAPAARPRARAGSEDGSQDAERRWRGGAAAAPDAAAANGGGGGAGGGAVSASATAQLARWEEYADEVEEQMRQLLGDNATLQAALAETRAALEAARPSVGSTSEGAPLKPCLGPP